MSAGLCTEAKGRGGGPSRVQVPIEKHMNRVYNMLYIGNLIIVDGQNVKKNPVSEISIFELQRLESYRSKLCPSPVGTPSPKKHPNRVKNTERGHSSFSVHWNMYRGRGAGRWAESSSGARVLPYKPPA